MNYSKSDLEIEKKLVEHAKSDPESFGKLYELNYDQIFAYVLKRTADIQVAQDITAETFFKALKTIHNFKWQNVPFSAWLYRIAINEINLLHRKGHYKPISLDGLKDQGFDPISADNMEEEFLIAQHSLERHAQFLQVQKELERIPAKYRDVITLRFFTGKQISEIAQILGKPEGTVKSLLHRGLEKLKKVMSSEQINATFSQRQHYE